MNFYTLDKYDMIHPMFTYVADVITYKLFHLTAGTKLAEIIHFFFYDSLKILFMIAFVIFCISFARSFFPPQKIKKILSHPVPGVSNLIASLFGAVSPFCSCSSIPLFLGFVEARVPLGVAFSFLITSPLVNEVVFVIMIGTFGLKVATAYALSGILLGVIAGMILGRMNLEYLLIHKTKEIPCIEQAVKGLPARIRFSYLNTKDIFTSIFKFVLIGVALGAVIHGYVPKSFFESYIGKGNFFAVPLAVLVGIPVYAGCSTLVPVIFAISSKGIPLGTALAFMMSIAGLSLPEAMILRGAIKTKLLLIFYAIVALGIIAIGYFFNWFL